MKTGLVRECNIGEKPRWSIGHRQGVYFLPEEKRICTTVEQSLVSVTLLADGQVKFAISHLK